MFTLEIITWINVKKQPFLRFVSSASVSYYILILSNEMNQFYAEN